MLIVNDKHRIAAGIKSLSKKCSYCSKPLSEYPLIMNDDAGFHVFHAACAAALATDIIVDLYTFFIPPAPYHRFFVLTAQEAACNTARLYPRMTRIFIHPDWVGLLDFETRLPSAVERAIERA